MRKPKVLLLCDNSSLRRKLDSLRDFFYFFNNPYLDSEYSLYICQERKLFLLNRDNYQKTLFIAPRKRLPLYYPLHFGSYLQEDFGKEELAHHLFTLQKNKRTSKMSHLRHLFTTREWIILKGLYNYRDSLASYSYLESLLGKKTSVSTLREIIYRIRNKMENKLPAINIKNIRNQGYVLFDDL